MTSHPDHARLSRERLEERLFQLEQAEAQRLRLLDELEQQNRTLRQARSELEASRNRYAELFDRAPVGYLVLDAGGRIRRANLTAAQLLHSERGLLEDRTLAAFLTRASGERFRDFLRRFEREGVCDRVTLEFAGAGAPRIMQLECGPYREPGCPTPLLGVALVNVTARHLAEGLLRLVTDAAPLLISYVDSAQRYRLVNAGYEAWFGLPRDAIVGRHLREVLGEPAYRAVLPRVERVLGGERVTYEEWVPYRHGGDRQVAASYIPHCSEEGTVLGFCALVRDVTRQRREEEALRQSEARLAAFADATFEGVVLSERGRILDCNRQFAHMLGYTEEELKGRSIEELVVPEVRTRVMAYIRGEHTSAMEHEVLRRDGTRISVEVHGQPRPELGAGRRYTVLRDVTAQRRRERELHQLNRTLRAIGDSRLAQVQARSESEYLDRVCRIIVEDCGHALVWIGYAGRDREKRVRPVAHAGFEAGFLETLGLTWDDSERGSGPTGTAIRTGRMAVCRNMLTDPRYTPWRDEARKRGYASSIAFPLSDSSGVFGAVCIYSREPDPFSRDEIRLLGDLSDDLAFGVRNIRLREAHARAERDLARRTRELEALIDTMPAMVSVKDAGLRYVTVNRALCEAIGITPEQALGRRSADFLPGALARDWDDSDRRAVAAGGPLQAIEEPLTDRAGRQRWLSTSKTPFHDDDGRLAGLVTISMDITGRKQEEAARLAGLERQRDTLVREVHHRIKNHLQGVVGLLRNQLTDFPDVSAPLLEAINQIRTIAQVYGLQSCRDDARVLLDGLILAAAGVPAGPVPVQCRMPESAPELILASEEAVPLALVVNELIANAVKHLAEPDPRRPVQVSLAPMHRGARIEVRGGPAHLPSGFDFVRGEETGTGLELVGSLLPPNGARLRIFQQGEEVVAELLLEAPVVRTEPATAP